MTRSSINPARFLFAGLACAAFALWLALVQPLYRLAWRLAPNARLYTPWLWVADDERWTYRSKLAEVWWLLARSDKVFVRTPAVVLAWGVMVAVAGFVIFLLTGRAP